MFCPAELPSGAMAMALRDIGRAAGKVKMVGFDAGSKSIEDLRNDYFEDPAWGLNGMRRVRSMVRIPTATRIS